MVTRLVPWALLGVVLAAGPAPADAKPAPPTALVRVSSLDELIASARYLVALAGREEQARQFDAMLKEQVAADGLKGVDTKKPVGFYARVAKRLNESQALLMLPLADEKAFLSTLEELDLTPVKDKTGVYSLKVERVPYPILFRIANGYVYGTLQFSKKSADNLANDRLPPPAVLAGKPDDLVTATINLDQIPDEVKDLALGLIDQGLANAKEQETPGASEAAKKLREAGIDEIGAKIKALFDDGGALGLRLALNRKRHDLAVTASLAGKPGSELAKTLAALDAGKSPAAGLGGPGSAVRAGVDVRLPAAFTKALGPVVDEMGKKIVAGEKDAERRPLLAELVNALKPTAKAGVLDGGFDFRGPAKDGKYTVVFVAQVRDGANIEKTFKKVLAKLPEAVQEVVKVDVDKAAGVNIHRVTPDKGKTDARTKEILGDGPFYVALRDDAAFVAMGEGALQALKEALTAKPAAAPPLRLEASLLRLPQFQERLAKRFRRDPKAVAAAAKKAFAAKDSDKVRLTVEGGKCLRVSFHAKTQVIAFVGQLAAGDADEKEKD